MKWEWLLTCNLSPRRILRLHLAGELVKPLARQPLPPVLGPRERPPGQGVGELARPRLHVLPLVLRRVLLPREPGGVLRGLHRAGVLWPLTLSIMASSKLVLKHARYSALPCGNSSAWHTWKCCNRH